MEKKFCPHCGASVDAGAAVCPGCGQALAKNASAEPKIVINNVNQNSLAPNMRQRNKWAAFWLCFFFGGLGAHKFYEGKTGMGILYLFTGGLLMIGTVVDLITLLFKPNPYYV